MYQKATENKIYRSKMRKVLLRICICIAYEKHMGVCKVQDFLNWFSITEKDYEKGIKELEKRHIKIE
jgi:hypothetical protein